MKRSLNDPPPVPPYDWEPQDEAEEAYWAAPLNTAERAFWRGAWTGAAIEAALILFLLLIWWLV